MIRGLRLLPWLQEARRSNPDSVNHYFNCDGCMNGTQTTHPISVETRQYWGCGYLPPLADDKPVMPWNHVGRAQNRDEVDERGRLLHPVCPGYVCDLPEVHEASDAHLTSTKFGGLPVFCEGKPPTPMLRRAVTLLECEYARVIDWKSNQKASK